MNDAETERHIDAVSERHGDAVISASPSPSVTASGVLASDLRILLWDIDGTLIRSLRVCAYKEYTIPVHEDGFGTSGRLANKRVSGMTDLQIIAEALRDEGY